MRLVPSSQCQYQLPYPLKGSQLCAIQRRGVGVCSVSVKCIWLVLDFFYVALLLKLLSKVELVKIAPPFQLVEKNY